MKIDLDREAAFKALLAIERDGSYSNLELSKMLASDELSNKGFIREIVYGVTENKIYLDYILDKFIKKGAAKTKLQALIILRMGVYQILFMNSVPNYAAVNESVALARRFARGTDGFINGVLRNFIRNTEHRITRTSMNPKRKSYPCSILFFKAISTSRIYQFLR